MSAGSSIQRENDWTLSLSLRIPITTITSFKNSDSDVDDCAVSFGREAKMASLMSRSLRCCLWFKKFDEKISRHGIVVSKVKLNNCMTSDSLSNDNYITLKCWAVCLWVSPMHQPNATQKLAQRRHVPKKWGKEYMPARPSPEDMSKSFSAHSMSRDVPPSLQTYKSSSSSSSPTVSSQKQNNLPQKDINMDKWISRWLWTHRSLQKRRTRISMPQPGIDSQKRKQVALFSKSTLALHMCPEQWTLKKTYNADHAARDQEADVEGQMKDADVQ
jgi:hypothetical protein